MEPGYFPDFSSQETEAGIQRKRRTGRDLAVEVSLGYILQSGLVSLFIGLHHDLLHGYQEQQRVFSLPVSEEFPEALQVLRI